MPPPAALLMVLVVAIGSIVGSVEPAAAGKVSTRLTLMGWNIRGQGQNQTWNAARASIVAYLVDSGAGVADRAGPWLEG